MKTQISWSIVACAVLVGCGGSGEAAPLECGTNLASDEELALTPREDINLEQLGIVATNRVVSGQAQYERVVRDVEAVRAMRPDLRDVAFLADFQPELIIRASESTIRQMLEGSYAAWDCLNERFKVVDIGFGQGTPDRADLVFDGVYHTPTLAERYARLPGIESASAGLRFGDGSTICVTPGADNWHYVFDVGSGSCETGCNDHDYNYYISKADGTITPSGSWAERSPDPRPQWVDNYVTDRACHGRR